MKRHRGKKTKRAWLAAACAVFVLAASYPAGVSAKEKAADPAQAQAGNEAVSRISEGT